MHLLATKQETINVFLQTPSHKVGKLFIQLEVLWETAKQCLGSFKKKQEDNKSDQIRMGVEIRISECSKSYAA